MNILILVSSLNYGGAEKQALLDANMLSTGQNVYLCSFFGGPLEQQIQPGVKLLRVQKSGYFKTALSIARLVKEHNIQIIHAHLFASSVISALASLLTSVSVIWHFHAHRFESPSKGKATLKWLSRLRSVKKLLFVNTELRDYFLGDHYGFPVKKCIIMYNSAQQHPAEVHFHQGKPIRIGFIGRLVELKRVEFLVELAGWLKSRDCNDFEIEIVGDGPEKERLEKISSEAGVSDKVHFMGFRSDTANFYAKFDLFILPSREECLSIALIDAGVWGIPSIAFAVGGNDEIIRNGVTGYIVQTKDELFDKVKYLMDQPAEREQMSKAAKEFCGSVFGEETHLASLTNLYKGIVSAGA
ncbi:MAG: glycosyltransferase [Bacteroidetes bacterium]|nr:glycosyltransferase [Bacteroidota bacterium]